jgi:hypothetical protein
LLLITLLYSGSAIWAKDLPDLVIDKFEVVQLAPGESSADGVTYATKHLFFVWTVSNRGTGVSNPTTLNVTCSMEKGGISGPCPVGLTKNYYIGGLWPRPGEISGTQVVWNSPSIEAPAKGTKYVFSAQVNAGHSFEEVTYANNSFNSQYTEGLMSQFIPAGKFRHIAELEKGIKRGPIVGIADPDAKQLHAQQGLVALIGPQVTVQGIVTQPAPLKANTPFELTIQFVNSGKVAQDPGKQYSLACRVLNGGPACPLPVGMKTINQSIPPGGIHFAKFAGITGPAGSYELTVKLLPEKRGAAAFISTVNIGPNLMMQKVPLVVPKQR